MKQILKGLLIGVAFLIPGLSGASMMILGIFDDTIHSIDRMLHFDFSQSKNFLCLCLGCIVGILAFASVIVLVLKTYYQGTMFFFTGMMGYGIFMIKRELQFTNVKMKLAFFAIGFVFISFFAFFPIQTLNVYLGGASGQIIAGVMIAIAMILPGISTAHVLLMFNIYETTLIALNQFDIAYFVPIALGVVAGLFAFTRLFVGLMNRNKAATGWLSFGFVVGSVFIVFPGIPGNFIDIVLLILGFGGMIMVDNLLRRGGNDNGKSV